MDEPTNHLDIKSKNVLKEACKNFEGTLIIVSHDRDFLQGLTSTVYEFRNKQIKEYLGDIDYYLEQRKLEDMRAVEKRDKAPKTAVKKETSEKQSYEDQKKLKTLNNKLSKIESKITKIEKELKKKDHDLATNYEKTIAQAGFLDSYNDKKKYLKSLMKEWEDLQLEIEEIS